MGPFILRRICQHDPWATRVSFVCHSGESVVYPCLQGDFTRVIRHPFA